MAEHDDENETSTDGLPVDPVKRQAAVAAQFDDFKEQIAALTPAVKVAGRRKLDNAVGYPTYPPGQTRH